MTKPLFAYKGTFGGLLYTLANSVADKKAIEKMHREVPQVLNDIEQCDKEEMENVK